MPTFSRSLEQSLQRALALANERHHEYATLEHLLLERFGAGVPLLANLYMRRFVLGWKMLGLERSLGSRIVTYADYLVILCKKGKAEEALARSSSLSIDWRARGPRRPSNGTRPTRLLRL
jgi:hypothetical protein